MRACPAPGQVPPRGRGRTRSGRWCPLGVCAEALLFLLSALTDACELPPPFEAMELVGEPKPYYEVGEQIRYKCKKGYLYLLPFLTIATCEPNHTWVPITDEGCVKIQCNILQRPSHGTINYIDGDYGWGSRVQFACIEGFYLVGKALLHCVLKGEDAYWNGERPRCERIFCSPPPKIQNGTHTFTDIAVFKYREAVTYSCDDIPGSDQFSLIGNSLLFCSGNNTWSSKPPQCRVVYCPSPELEHGKQIGGLGKKFPYGAAVIFECVEGFYLKGSEKVVCSASSTWNPSIPVCLKGPKPTHPPKPPVYKYPGYPKPQEGIFDQELDSWIIGLIVVTASIFKPTI